MRNFKIALVAVVAAFSMFMGASAANAGPLDEVCDNFPGPRDGKAVWYTLLCR